MVRHRVLYRLIAVMLLQGILGASPTVALCVGWASSHAERMACCQRGAPGCSSISADSCCADGEQRQNVEMAAVVIRPQDSTASVAFIDLRQPLAPADPRSLAARPDTYLLDSVFRI